MKATVLMERFPYRYMETQERGWVEKFSHETKRYTHMYEVGCEQQMVCLLDDPEYVKILDPSKPPCYVRSRVSAPYNK